MQSALHGGSSGPGDASDLLGVLLESCAEYIALGWSLEQVVLVWREKTQETAIPAAKAQSRAPALASARRSGPPGIGRARQRAHQAIHGGAWEATVGFVRPVGRHFATRVLIAPVRDARGRPTGFFVVSQHHEGTPLRGRVAVHEARTGPQAALDAWLRLTKPALRFEPVSCRTVVRQVADALRPMAKRLGLQFETRLPRQDLVVRTDRRALTDILLSLANYAIGLTDRGKIRLEAGARRDDHGRRFSEIRVVGGTVAGTNVSQVQAVGQDDARADTGSGAREVAVHRSDQLARRLGGRISVDYALGRRSAFALMLPNVPPRQKHKNRLTISKDT